ncbi:Hypothetical predicted protein [Octopus vulgaris]|uniref:Uncharacterized protein n=1 Tax=Octopus vulgaris TaxID=6645 RepID=A0AA36B886_OCTVU|nr:Hypothetical predicted protein [Octopus vulgaris]
MVEVRFHTEEAKSHFLKPLKSEDLLLVPFYCDQRLAKIIIQQMSPEITITLLIAAVIIGIDENSKILEVYQTKKENWSGMSIEVFIQTNQKNVDLIPDQIHIPGDIIPLRVDGRNAKCRICLSITYLKAFCPRLRGKESQAPLPSTPTTATRTRVTTAAAPPPLPSADSATVAPIPTIQTPSSPKHFSASEDVPLPDAKQVGITCGEYDRDEEWKTKSKRRKDKKENKSMDKQ